MKRLFLTLLFCLLATQGECAVKYLRNVSGNMNANDSYSTTGSGGAADTTVATAADDVICDASFTGTITITATQTINSLVCLTGAAGTLSHGSATLTIDGQDGSGNTLLFVSTMTYSHIVGARITFTGSGTSKITTAGKRLRNTTFNNSGDTFQLQDDLYLEGSPTLTAGIFDANGHTVFLGDGSTTSLYTITGDFTFYNLTVTGINLTTDVLTIGTETDISVTNTLTINGNSNVNRLLVTSNTLGTSRYINATNYSINNTDFRVIRGGNGTVDWNLAAYSTGDCGGNTNITFTPAEPQKWVNNTGSWSNSTHWLNNTGGGIGRVPLPQDDVFFDASSFTGTSTVTADMPRLGRTIDWSASTQTTTFALGNDVTIYGGWDGTSLNTYNAGSDSMTFEGRGVFSWIPNSGLKDMSFKMFGGILNVLGNAPSGYVFYHYNGILNITGNIFSTRKYSSSNSNARTLIANNATWELTPTSTLLVWDIPISTNYNLTASNFLIRNNGAFIGNFSGGSLTYDNYTYNSSAATAFYGNNTFNVFTVENIPATLKFTDGTTQNVTSFVANGKDIGIIYLNGTSTGGWNINSTQNQQVYNCTISYSTAGGGGVWTSLLTDENVNVTGNSGWIWESAGGAVDDSQVWVWF